MEAALERRSTPGSRIPFETPVELDLAAEQIMVADAVNLGLGGLTVKGSVLPHLGQRLTCRFTPQLGHQLEVPVEVVWSDAGQGQCGIKFLQLDYQSERSLRSLVLGAYVPPPIEDPPPPVESGCRRINFHGVDGPVTVKVLHEDFGGLTVEQALPFLAIDTSILTEEGRAGRIETVELVVDRGIPRLVVDLAYDEPMQLADSTLRDESAPEAQGVMLRSSKATLPGVGPAEADGFWDGTGVISADVDVDLSDAHDVEPSPPAETRAEPENEVQLDEPQLAVSEPATQRDDLTVSFHTPVPEETKDAPRVSPKVAARASQAGAALERAPADVLMELPAGLWKVVGVVRRAAFAAWVLVAAKLAPLTAQFRRVVWPELSKRVMRGTSAGRRAMQTAWSTGKSQLSRRGPQRAGLTRTQKRRTRGPSQSAAAPAAAAPKRLRIGRWLLVSVVLGAGVAILVGTSPEPKQPDVPAVGAGVETADGREPSDSALVAAGEPASEQRPSPASQSAVPSAPGVVPADSPYASSEEASGPTETAEEPAGMQSMFGESQVESGKTFVLRMSQPVVGIIGSQLTDGFKVVVPGSLSLDRAGPIARAHDRVERSMILNHGNHAELTVRFVAGEPPPYRIRPRGSAVEVTIGG